MHVVAGAAGEEADGVPRRLGQASASASRYEAVFDDPFRFDITRTPNEHVAFGFGPHFCLGASLARLEISVMLEELTTRFPDLDLAHPDAEVELRPANFISGIEHLPVTFSPGPRAGQGR